MIQPVRQATKRLCIGDEGQDLLEYALLACLIAVVAFGAVSSVGNTIDAVFWTFIDGAVNGI